MWLWLWLVMIMSEYWSGECVLGELIHAEGGGWFRREIEAISVHPNSLARGNHPGTCNDPVLNFLNV